MAFRPEIHAPQTGDKRWGRGFSFQELKEAGISLSEARWMAIPIDGRRKTHHAENVKTLQEYLARIKKLGKVTKTVKDKPKPKPKSEKPAIKKTKLVETDLTEISGISKKLAETLVNAGITSIHDLATVSPRRLARKTDLKRNRSEKLVESAKRYEREKAKAVREEKAKEPLITEIKHLPEITRTDVKLLKELGVKSLADLKGENPRDLALLTGIPESRIKEWRKEIRKSEKE